MHRGLCNLSSTFHSNTKFAKWTKLLLDLSPKDRADQERQALAFFKYAIETYEKHLERWLTDLVDTSLADDPRLAVPVARRLLEIFDGVEKTSISDDVIVLDGVEHNLSSLVADMTQFATSEGLRTRSVLFMRGAKVVDQIRLWVKADGDFGAAPTLSDLFGTFILAMAHSTHFVERFVGEGTLMSGTYRKGLSEKRFSILVCTRKNFTNPAATEAYETYKESIVYQSREKKQEPSNSWRRRGMPVVRTASNTRNKQMLCLRLAAFRKRVESLKKPGFIAESRAREAERRFHL
jgi:hypothetical protein